MTDNRLCCRGLEISELLFFGIGALMFDCMVEVEKCENSYVEFEGNQAKINLGDKTIIVCSGKCVGDVVLNRKINDYYVHLLYDRDRNRQVDAFMTTDRIELPLFVGALFCLLKRENLGLRDAFNRALAPLIVSGNNPFKYYRLVESEYNCLMRILNAVNRLVSRKALLEKMLDDFGDIVIACRGLGERILVSKIVASYPEPLVVGPWVTIDKELREIIKQGSSILCMPRKSTGLEEKFHLLRYRYYMCISGKDPVKILIDLEKNLL